MYRFTSLSRTLDPRYPTNLAILVAVPLAGVIMGIVRLLNGASFTEAALAGFYTGAATIITWVLTREIDPDNERSALLAAFLGFLSAFVLAVPAIIPLAGLIILLRIVNRIVGQPAKPFDSIVALLWLAAALLSGSWVFGIIVTLAFVMDALLPQPLRIQWIFAILAALATFAYGVANNFPRPSFEFEHLLPVLAVSIAFIVVILTTRSLTSRADYTQEALNTNRIRAGMALTLIMGIVFVMWEGNTGLRTMLPLWSAMTATILYRVAITLMARR